jgi:tetratricopeptide (TPR) repeat protein
MRQPHPNRARAMVLMGLRRFADAEKELRLALRDEPDDAGLHALLATCLVEDPARHDEAEAAAMHATTLAVEQPFPWYVMSRVAARRGKPDTAEHAARIAVGLNPQSADLLAQLAAAELDLGRTSDGLETARRGLRVDPEHLACANLAAGVLSRQGKHEEAREILARALAKEPENAVTHCNLGWDALRRGDAHDAVRYFREALRLDPRWASARTGLMESMKARNPVYRFILLSSMRLPFLAPELKWLAVAAGLIAVLWLPALAEDLRLPAWTALPFQVAVVAAVLLTWTARSVFDVVLFFDPLGRRTLTPIQQACAFNTALALGVAATMACLSIFTHEPGAGIGAILFAMVTIPIAATLRARAGWPQKVLAVYTFAVTCLAFAAMARDAGAGGAGTLFGVSVGAMAMSDLLSTELSRRK